MSRGKGKRLLCIVWPGCGCALGVGAILLAMAFIAWTSWLPPRGGELEPTGHLQVLTVGDLDGDGAGDLVLRGAFDGALTVRSGRDGSTLVRPGESYLAPPERCNGDGFTWDCHPFDPGTFAAGVGDVDGDGHPDLAVRGATAAAVRVLCGADGRVLHVLHVPATLQGPSIHAVGDLDADGHADVGVQAAERFAVHSGRTGEVLLAWNSGAGRLLPCPDLDGDGHDDRVQLSGAVVTARSVTTGRTLWQRVLPREGRSVLPVQDADGDGVADLWIAGSWQMQVARLSGRTGVLLGIIRLPGWMSGDVELARVADWNGDGRDDVLMAFGRHRVVVDAVTAEVLRDVGPGTTPAPPWGIWTSGGDVDGDGAVDLAVLDGSDRVRVFSGRTLAPILELP